MPKPTATKRPTGRPPGPATIARRQQQAESLAWLAGDPVRFARGILRHKTWRMQEIILRSVAEHPLTAVKACHASSKTFTASEAVLWWISHYDDGIVVTTAPTWLQVETLLWGEIRKAIAQARIIRYPEPNQTELKLAEGNYAIGLSTNEGVRFQGFHGKHVLIVLDEAPGVRGDIWEAIEGVRAGGKVHVLAIGNPTVTSGPFFDAFHKDRGIWQTFTISALDTPNLKGLTLDALLKMPEHDLDDNPVPYLVTRRWVRERLTKWGRDSDIFRARVLGEFPHQGIDSLIALAWVEAANRTRHPVGGMLEAGLDPARFGDDSTALCLREGANIVGEWEWHGLDTMQSVGRAAHLLAQHRPDLHALKVDVDGLGAGVADRLREQGWPVVDIHGAATPIFNSRRGATRFLNRRAELWWNIRETLRQGQVGGPIHEDTQAELVGVRYGINSAGEVFIERKEDAKKRGIPSPNRADAFVLAFAPTGAPKASTPPRRAMRVS